MHRFCKIWNFAQDYTEFMNRYYVTVLPVPTQVYYPTVATTSSTFSIEVGRYLIYLCRCLRGTFEKLYDRLGPIHELTEEQFMQFCISRCEKFCFMKDDMALLIACAFISELNNYLFLREFYGLNMASWKCFLAVFRRQFHMRFPLDRGWERLRLFCRGKNVDLIPSTFEPVIDLNLTHFTNYSLGGKWNLSNKYVSIPLSKSKKLTTFPALNEFERVLLSSDLNRAAQGACPSCEYCFGPCIEKVYSAGMIDDLMKIGQ